MLHHTRPYIDALQAERLERASRHPARAARRHAALRRIVRAGAVLGAGRRARRPVASPHLRQDG